MGKIVDFFYFIELQCLRSDLWSPFYCTHRGERSLPTLCSWLLCVYLNHGKSPDLMCTLKLSLNSSLSKMKVSYLRKKHFTSIWKIFQFRDALIRNCCRYATLHPKERLKQLYVENILNRSVLQSWKSPRAAYLRISIAETGAELQRKFVLLLYWNTLTEIWCDCLRWCEKMSSTTFHYVPKYCNDTQLMQIARNQSLGWKKRTSKK